MPRGKPFQKGYDSRRHVFTQEECKRGYESLVTKISLNKCCGDYWARRWAFRKMCKTESVRYNNPDIEIRD